MAKKTQVIALGVTAALKDNWKDFLPGPKLGRLKDQEKIDAKIAEWEEKAQDEALHSRLASTVDRFVFCEVPSGDVLAEGAGAADLVSAAISLTDRVGSDVKIYGIEARRRMSQAVLELWADRADIEIPRKLWDYDIGTTRDTDGCPIDTVIDPVSMLMWLGEEKSQVLAALGVDDSVYTNHDLKARVTVSGILAKRIHNL